MSDLKLLRLTEDSPGTCSGLFRGRRSEYCLCPLAYQYANTQFSGYPPTRPRFSCKTRSNDPEMSPAHSSGVFRTRSPRTIAVPPGPLTGFGAAAADSAEHPSRLAVNTTMGVWMVSTQWAMRVSTHAILCYRSTRPIYWGQLDGEPLQRKLVLRRGVPAGTVCGLHDRLIAGTGGTVHYMDHKQNVAGLEAVAETENSAPLIPQELHPPGALRGFQGRVVVSALLTPSSPMAAPSSTLRPKSTQTTTLTSASRRGLVLALVKFRVISYQGRPRYVGDHYHTASVDT
ncbi:hypothetical protein B0H11DRAFT_2187054 [Mycena galericulata]|nr:hypothetical protein B0H11DRAFT_2187054 [Mycena galericulata]